MASHDTSTVRVSEERQAKKIKRTQWWLQANWPRLKEALVKSRDPYFRGQWDVACYVGYEVNYVPFVYPRGTVSVSSLGYFSFVGSSSKPSHPSLPLSLGAHNIQEYFKRKMGRKQKFIKPQ